MSRKDTVYLSFISHSKISSEYEIAFDDLPKSLSEGLISQVPILKAIAIIVDGLENQNPLSDVNLRTTINQYLNHCYDN